MHQMKYQAHDHEWIDVLFAPDLDGPAQKCPTCNQYRSAPPALFVVPPAARRTDPETSKKAARNGAPRRGTQAATLLSTFAHPSVGADGLTSYEAGDRSGLMAKTGCCYWKRVSELAANGYITATGEKRLMPTGEEQTVYAITPAGHAALQN